MHVGGRESQTYHLEFYYNYGLNFLAFISSVFNLPFTSDKTCFKLHLIIAQSQINLTIQAIQRQKLQVPGLHYYDIIMDIK